MTSLPAFIKELKQIPSLMGGAAQSVLDKEVPGLIRGLQAHAPVDTGDYRDSWRRRRGSQRGTLASITIENLKHRAGLMELGSEPGEAPWYYPNSAQTGKLKEVDGRIWAGGLSPGHALTVGGAIDPVIVKNPTKVKQITEDIADAIIKEIM